MQFLSFGAVIALALIASSSSYPNVPQDLSHQEEGGAAYDWGLNVHFFKDGEDSEKDFYEDERIPRVENGPIDLFSNLKSSKKCSSDKQCKPNEFCGKYKACVTFPKNKLYEDVFPSETQFGQRYADAFV